MTWKKNWTRSRYFNIPGDNVKEKHSDKYYTRWDIMTWQWDDIFLWAVIIWAWVGVLNINTDFAARPPESTLSFGPWQSVSGHWWIVADWHTHTSLWWRTHTLPAQDKYSWLRCVTWLECIGTEIALEAASPLEFNSCWTEKKTKTAQHTNAFIKENGHN